MSLEPFQKSGALSLGVELELQLVNTHDYDLAQGINACLAKNGENAMTGSLNMGGQGIVRCRVSVTCAGTDTCRPTGTPSCNRLASLELAAGRDGRPGG